LIARTAQGKVWYYIIETCTTKRELTVQKTIHN